MPARPIRRFRLVRQGQEKDSPAMQADVGLSTLRQAMAGVLARDLAERQQVADAVARALRTGQVTTDDGEPWYEWVYDPIRDEWTRICHENLVLTITDGDGRPALLTIEDERNLGA